MTVATRPVSAAAVWPAGGGARESRRRPRPGHPARLSVDFGGWAVETVKRSGVLVLRRDTVADDPRGRHQAPGQAVNRALRPARGSRGQPVDPTMRAPGHAVHGRISSGAPTLSLTCRWRTSAGLASCWAARSTTPSWSHRRCRAALPDRPAAARRPPAGRQHSGVPSHRQGDGDVGQLCLHDLRRVPTHLTDPVAASAVRERVGQDELEFPRPAGEDVAERERLMHPAASRCPCGCWPGPPTGAEDPL